jgi:hypothetical protein
LATCALPRCYSKGSRQSSCYRQGPHAYGSVAVIFCRHLLPSGSRRLISPGSRGHGRSVNVLQRSRSSCKRTGAPMGRRILRRYTFGMFRPPGKSRPTKPFPGVGRSPDTVRCGHRLELHRHYGRCCSNNSAGRRRGFGRQQPGATNTAVLGTADGCLRSSPAGVRRDPDCAEPAGSRGEGTADRRTGWRGCDYRLAAVERRFGHGESRGRSRDRPRRTCHR